MLIIAQVALTTITSGRWHRSRKINKFNWLTEVERLDIFLFSKGRNPWFVWINHMEFAKCAVYLDLMLIARVKSIDIKNATLTLSTVSFFSATAVNLHYWEEPIILVLWVHFDYFTNDCLRTSSTTMRIASTNHFCSPRHQNRKKGENEVIPADIC